MCVCVRKGAGQPGGLLYRASESVVFNSGQKMAVRAFYFTRALTKALTFYYIKRSQRHLFGARFK